MARVILPIGVSILAAIVGCAPGGNLCILGYSSAPPFDPSIRTVYVPVFKRNVFLTTPNRSLDVDITEAVKDELNARKGAPRIVSDPSRADTELIGTIVNYTKTPFLYNVQALSRDVEINIRVEVIWRDLRTGELLTNPKQPIPTPPSQQEFDPNVAPPTMQAFPRAAVPVVITGKGRILAELGESNLTANNAANASIARQIVNMMESTW